MGKMAFVTPTQVSPYSYTSSDVWVSLKSTVLKMSYNVILFFFHSEKENVFLTQNITQ